MAAQHKPTHPRVQYRRNGDLHDTVVLELRVPAGLIPWLEFYATWFGPGVEDAGAFLLKRAVAELQEQRFGQGGPR